MLTNERERKICKKYSARDDRGFVHCSKCPLRRGEPQEFKCKANSHYDRKQKIWEFDRQGLWWKGVKKNDR